MKKTLALVLALAMVLSFAAMASAAVTVGGNLRVWYGDSDNGTSKVSSIKFDRLALDVNADLGDNSGLITEVQFRNILTNASTGTVTGTVGSDGTSVTGTSTNSTDIRVDLAYWYKKNLFMDGGTLMVGAFDGQVPFKNGYSNVLINGGLGDALKIGNSVGVVYQINQPTYAFGVGVVNGKTNVDRDSTYTAAQEDEGFDWSARFDYLPAAGLKIGVGYANVFEKFANATAQSGKIMDNRWIVDASYKNLDVTPFSGMVEYAKVSPDSGSVLTDDAAAIYGELGYTFGSAVAYVGRGIGLDDKNVYGTIITSTLFGGSSAPLINNYTVVGLNYGLTKSTFLQGEYVDVSGSDSRSFGLRLRVNF